MHGLSNISKASATSLRRREKRPQGRFRSRHGLAQCLPLPRGQGQGQGVSAREGARELQGYRKGFQCIDEVRKLGRWRMDK